MVQGRGIHFTSRYFLALRVGPNQREKVQREATFNADIARTLAPEDVHAAVPLGTRTGARYFQLGLSHGLCVLFSNPPSRRQEPGCRPTNPQGSTFEKSPPDAAPN